MNQAAEQFLASATTAVTDLNTLATTAMAGFEKLVELNLATAKSALADSAEQMQAGFATKAPQDMAAMASLAQPMADKAAAYGRAVAGIGVEESLTPGQVRGHVLRAGIGISVILAGDEIDRPVAEIAEHAGGPHAEEVVAGRERDYSRHLGIVSANQQGQVGADAGADDSGAPRIDLRHG